MTELKGIGGGKPLIQAEEAVTRSGPWVAERVGIALCDVFKGRGSVSVSVGGDTDDGGVLDPGSGMGTTVLKTTSVSVSVTVFTSTCLLTSVMRPSSAECEAKALLKLLGLSEANVAVDTTVTNTVDQSESAAVGIDPGASVLTWSSRGGRPQKNDVPPPPQIGIGVKVDVDEVPTQVTPSRGCTPQLPGADSVHTGSGAADVDAGASVRMWLRGGMIQGKSGESQLGIDEEVTEHVISSTGGSIHGPQEKGTHESGLPSPIMILVMIVVQGAVTSETGPSKVAAGVGSGASFVRINDGTWAVTYSTGPSTTEVICGAPDLIGELKGQT